MDLIMAIVAACTIHTGGDFKSNMDKRIEALQARCHAYYSNCINRGKRMAYPELAVMYCMKKRYTDMLDARHKHVEQFKKSVKSKTPELEKLKKGK